MIKNQVWVVILSGKNNLNTIDFYIVDVFTTQKYGGNQLGVFVDYEDLLSDEDMLHIARELNFSEVSFIKKTLITLNLRFAYSHQSMKCLLLVTQL